MASAMKLRDTDPAERVLDYLTTLAREQDVHVVTLDAIIGACDIRPLKWPELLNKLADKVEAAPGRDAYRLRKKRDLMARLTDEERVVGHLLKGPASPAEIRQARMAILMARLTDEETGPQPPPVEATPMVEERAPPSTPEVEAIPEEQPQGSAALRKAVADHVGMSELASDGDLLEGLETMRAIVAAEHIAVQETRAALADLLEGLETMRAIVAAEHMAVQETRAALAAARADIPSAINVLVRLLAKAPADDRQTSLLEHIDRAREAGAGFEAANVTIGGVVCDIEVGARFDWAKRQAFAEKLHRGVLAGELRARQVDTLLDVYAANDRARYLKDLEEAPREVLAAEYTLITGKAPSSTTEARLRLLIGNALAEGMI